MRGRWRRLREKDAFTLDPDERENVMRIMSALNNKDCFSNRLKRTHWSEYTLATEKVTTSKYKEVPRNCRN